MGFVLSNRLSTTQALWHAFLLITPQILLAYANMQWLVPRYFMHKRYLAYFLSVVALFVLLFLLFEALGINKPFLGDRPDFPGWRRSDFGPGPGPGPRRGYPFVPDFPKVARVMRSVFNIVLSLGVFLLSTAYKASLIALHNEKEAQRLKSEGLESELRFLKSQINPHFLFNALNNVYSLSLIQSEKTPGTILKLSEMLRYILYDCNHEKVPLQKELAFISNYVDLMKLKDDQIENITLDLPKHTGSEMIEPMLFVPFVENAFKHGAAKTEEKAWIRIKLKVANQQLLFTAANSIPEVPYTKDSVGGIGLENVKRRLHLLYPNRHELKIEKTDKQFTVHLSILL